MCDFEVGDGIWGCRYYDLVWEYGLWWVGFGSFACWWFAYGFL